MRIAINHRLTISPPPGTGMLVLQVLLTPRDTACQTVTHWQVDIGGSDKAARFTDAFGNDMLLVNIPRPEDELALVVTGEVETRDLAGVLGKPAGEPVVALYKRLTKAAASPEGIVERFKGSAETRLSVLHGLMAAVGTHFGIKSDGAEQSQMQADGARGQSQRQPADQVDAAALAHGFVGACRDLDIPARLVTGYLLDAAQGISPFHIWAEAYDDGLGWVGFDPSIQLCPTDRHVRLATGLDLGDAQPLKMVPASDIRHDEISVRSA